MMTLAVLLAAMTTQLFAQQRNTSNLIQNPGFEEGANGHDHWKFISFFGEEDTQKPKTGQRALKVNIGGSATLTPKNSEGASMRYAIDGADSFTFSYWYRGAMNKGEVFTAVEYYAAEGDTRYKHYLKVPGSSISSATEEWTKQEFSIPTTTPKGDAVSHIVIYMEFKVRFGGFATLYFDDFSLNRVYTKPAIVVNKPEGLKAAAYQREAELTWEGSIDPEVSWEVQADGKSYTTKTPNYILTGLEPQREYNIKVVAKKEDVTSDAAELKVTTQSPYRSKDEEERIPYLRTVTRSEGQVRKTINLFYNDLYNGNAKITYYFDGVEIKPTGYQLTFPATGKHTLKVRIEESASEVWTLNYNLNINE